MLGFIKYLGYGAYNLVEHIYRGIVSIVYQTSAGDFVYTTDTSDNMVLVNSGDTGSVNNGLLYSGRAIELGALNDVEFPIHHSLGADTYSGSIIDSEPNTTITPITDGFNITAAVAVSASQFNITGISESSYKVLLEFTAVVNSGTLAFGAYFNGTSIVNFDTPYTVVNGANSIELETRASNTNQIQMYYVAGNVFNIDITLPTIKQITNPNSYLTLYDFTNGFEYIDCSTLTPSTTYTVNSKTINNVLTHTTAWSATDKAKIEGNPNLVGKLALETLGATKTIPELDMVMDAGASPDSYYMCSEKSGAYLVDSRVAYGASVSTVPVSVVNGDETTTYTKLSDTDFNLAVTIAGTNTVRPAMLMMPQTSGFFVISFDLIINSGTISQVKTYDNNALGIFSISEGSNAFIVKKTNVPADPYIYFDGTSTFDISVTNYATREATATEIANFASTIRTNADLQQKGIQTTAFVTDGAGVPTAHSSNLLQFDGDGRYVDTGWIPSASEDWTIELVSESIIPIGVSSYEICGVESLTNSVIIGTYSSNGIDRRRIIKVGDKINVDLLSVAEGDYVHLCVVYDSLSSTYIIYENNSASIPQSITTFTSGSTYSMVIGAKNANGTIVDKSSQPKGTFSLHKGKAMTATEVATAYAQAKIIYPTLP